MFGVGPLKIADGAAYGLSWHVLAFIGLLTPTPLSLTSQTLICGTEYSGLPPDCL